MVSVGLLTWSLSSVVMLYGGLFFNKYFNVNLKLIIFNIDELHSFEN